MTARRSPIRWSAGLLTLVLLELAGCAAAKRPLRQVDLLTPTAAPARDVLANPPSLDASLYSREGPRLTLPASAPLPGPSEVAPLLRQSESHFRTGVMSYRAGDLETARREFDAAVDCLLSASVEGSARGDVEAKLSELVDAIHQYDVSGLGAAEPDSEPVYDKAIIEDIPEPTFPVDPKLRNQVAEELKATVSQLPLELTDEVLRYINYFSSTRGKKILVYGLENMGRYRPLIRRILDEEGVPQELVHLAQAESAFAPRAVSYKAATGMWQFIQSRGQQYGLMRSKLTDDRFDPEKATRAAARHLRDLYNEFGDWYLAMAAYNCGPVTVEKAVERTGYADFWELRRRDQLPQQTDNYVPIILSMVIMAKNPGHYGLDGIEPDPPIEYSTVELEAATRLDLIADITERPVSELRQLNPALLSNLAPAGYGLHVPPGMDATVLSALQLVPPEKRTAWRLHRIAEGDTAAGVAVRYRTTTAQLLAANPSAANVWESGSMLIVPAPATVERQAPRRTTSAKSVASKKPAAATTRSSTRAKKAVAKPSSTPLVAAKKTATPRAGSAVR